MYKLRRSRFLKFTACILLLIFTLLLTANIFGTVIMMEENLYYADSVQVKQKVYSYVVDYVSRDLMKYLSYAEKTYSNDNSYQNYQKSEIELYNSKYSAQNSNIYFEIKDEYGNTILSNSPPDSDILYTFSSQYINESEHSDMWLDSDTHYYENTEDASYLYKYESSHYEGAATTVSENTEYTGTESARDIMTASETKTDSSDEAVTEIVVINYNSGNRTTLHYYYKGDINEEILSFCKKKTSYLEYDISDIEYHQDEFSVIHHNIYNDGSYETEITYNFDWIDEKQEKRSFSTLLICDDKNIPIEYSYNGTFCINEFENRLKYVSLIAEENVNTDSEFAFYQRGQIQLKLYIHIPEIFSASDIFSFAGDVTDILLFYKNNIIAFSAACVILALLCFVYIVWSAGYIPGHDAAVARGLHRIPFDILLVFCTALLLLSIILIGSFEDSLVVPGLIILFITCFSLFYTIPARIHAGTILTNNLTIKLSSVTKQLIRNANESKGTMLLIVSVLVLFSAINLSELILFCIFSRKLAAIIFIFMKFAEIPFILYFLVSLSSLHNGAKVISGGDISYRIKNHLFIGAMKKHADYLNNINNAVNSAVDERVKSESLKTELITNVSHDLKTPLTSIVNYIDLLKSEEINNEKANEYIEVIDRQSQRLKKLTFDIVEASKASTGNITINREKIALNVFLLQTNGEYIELLEEKSLTLVSEMPESNINIFADGRTLWRVIDNLMSNICKYSMQGTRVYISLWQEEDRACISFRNISKNKLNISPDELSERFVRGDASRNTEGSGLGLSIAKSLTELNGGFFNISIDGDLFKITLSFPIMNN